MKDFIKDEKFEVGKRLKTLRETLNLTQADIAGAIGVSKGTLAAIEAGKEFTDDSLLPAIWFFGMNLHDFITKSNISERQLRTRILKFHQGNEKVVNALNRKPELTALIRKTLYEGDFLDTGKTVAEIRDHFKDQYNVDFKSSAVSHALIVVIRTESTLKRVKKNGRNFLYQRK